MNFYPISLQIFCIFEQIAIHLFKFWLNKQRFWDFHKYLLSPNFQHFCADNSRKIKVYLKWKYIFTIHQKYLKCHLGVRRRDSFKNSREGGRNIYDRQESILSSQKGPTSPEMRSTDPGNHPNNIYQRRFVPSPLPPPSLLLLCCR